jgi:hypothetical protein
MPENEAVPERWQDMPSIPVVEAYAKGYGGAGMEIARRLDERDALRAEVERLREALTTIERLQAKWDAPVRSDDVAASDRAWAAV